MSMQDKMQALQKPLSVAEIDFRVQSINKGGYATILAYKDARADMRRLDQVFGVGYWQRKHGIIGNNLYCAVGIYNHEIKEWVWLQDVGTESNTEKEKGQASDSFKRACFNLGIGRELYDYPSIQVKLNPEEFEVDGNKAKATWKLKLREWLWYSEFDDDGNISFLAAKDDKEGIRFKWGTRKSEKSK